jgi:outer membrane protein assembly factor BamB
MIDLELAEPWEVPERPTGRPGTIRIVAALVTTLLLGSLSAGNRTDNHEPVFDLRGSIQDATLVRNTLVVMTSRPAQLRAYRIPDGHQRWSRDLPSSLTFMSSHRDLLFLTEYDGMDGASGRTRVLDGHTGRELWQRTDLWILARAGDRLVSARAPSPNGLDESSQGSPPQIHLELSGLDAHTGTVLWSRNLPTGATLTRTDGEYQGGRPGSGLDSFTATGSVGNPLPETVDDSMRLYDLGPDGVLHTLDPATGAVIVSTHLEVPPGPGLAIVGQVALVQQHDGTIWASDLSDGQPLWSRAADPTETIVSPCGDAACLIASGRTLVLDPATGTQQYEFASSTTAYRAAGRIVSVERALLRIRLIDPATGRPVAEFDGWSATGMFAGTRLVAARGGLDGPTQIAVLDLTTGRRRTIAQGDRGFLTPTCRGSDQHLVCWNGSGLNVWAVRRGTG